MEISYIYELKVRAYKTPRNQQSQHNQRRETSVQNHILDKSFSKSGKTRTMAFKNTGKLVTHRPLLEKMHLNFILVYN
jgi:hypothetical protein